MNFMNKKIFLSVLVSIVGLPSFAFFDGKVVKQHFYDKTSTIMQEEVFDSSIKTDEYWSENVLRSNKYRPMFMLSNKELYNLMPQSNIAVSERISTPSVYNVSFKNASIIKVSLNSKPQPAVNKAKNSTPAKYDNSKYIEIYESAKGSNVDPEDKVQAAILLKASKHIQNYNLAIDLLNDAIRKEPYNAYAYYLKGELYSLKKDNETAMKNYIESLKINPTNKQCFRSIAKLLEPTNKALAMKYYDASK